MLLPGTLPSRIMNAAAASDPIPLPTKWALTVAAFAAVAVISIFHWSFKAGLWCPSQSQRSDRRFGRHVANQLLVHELLDAHVAEFTPVARVLDAPEWQFGIGPADAVDEHHAGIDAACHSLATRQVLGEYGAA